MRKTMALLATVTVALLLLGAYLVHASLDQAVSLDHARATQRSLERHRAVLQKLMVDLAKGARRADMRDLLAARYTAHIVKEEGDTIFIDGVGLRFRGDELVAVVFLDDADGAAGGAAPH